MATFMSMQYDSDSDSADDLDFEPASDGSSGSDGDSTDEEMDEVMEDVEGEADLRVMSTISEASSSKATTAPASKKKPRPRSQQTPEATALVTPSATVPSLLSPPQNQQQPDSSIIIESASIATLTTITTDNATVKASEAVNDATLSLAATSSSSVPAASTTADANAPGGAPGEVVKKKKGPKKGTKYKKRVPVASDATGATGKASKTPKIDIDHPLETFKWPYSPFTAEFKMQHRARDTMAKELHQAVQQITDTNNRSTWHLQELDQRLQMSRQDLKTSLDEIQFRKSQLRDMSLMAVDIVRKLSSNSVAALSQMGKGIVGPAGSSPLSASRLLPGSTESTARASDLDPDAMELDSAENVSASGKHVLSRLSDLNESNVRSFLERIRELEQSQRHIMV
ncbi:hypothetical protein FBU30_003226 [Linnemannia zychae]|nr:hypothetical protein FBU30_003226 [Linnemannia zychae]